MRVLVTGAAGYIGSVVTEHLIDQGHAVVALDNLQHGHRAAVHPCATFVEADLLDREGLRHQFSIHSFDAVVHLAAEALIDVSVRDPGRFFRANVCGGVNLLDAMVATGVPRIVVSSTAAVYGEPDVVPVPEGHALRPVNAYGESKLVFERMLTWYHAAHRIRHITLRYFNACGATDRCGEYHVPETHLIAVLIEAALGQREFVELYGTDYDTPDGTCIRDYVHVADIAEAHVLALAAIDRLEHRVYNIGNGSGYSNREVIDTVSAVVGRSIAVRSCPRRIGDPARLVASSGRIAGELGWVPRFPGLRGMVESAWQWRQQHLHPYSA